MVNEYERIRNEYKEILKEAQEKDLWISILTATGAIYGKVSDLGENILRLKPSLIWEKGNKKKNKEDSFIKRDDFPTVLSYSFIYGIQPVSKEGIEALISQEENSAGFSQH